MVTQLKRVCRKCKALLTKLRLDFYSKPHRLQELPELEENQPSLDHRRSVRLDELSYLHVYILNSARIHTDRGDSVAVIDHQNRLVSGASWQYVNREHGEARDNNIFRKGIISAPRQYEGTVFSILTGGGGNGNYYHWLYDALPRLHLLERAGLGESVDYFFVPALRYPFQGETLDCLGIDRKKVISSLEVPHIKARKIITTDHPRPLHNDINVQIPEWICDFLRGSFLKKQIRTPLGSENVYISRKDTNKRRLLNEEELISALRPEGFVTVSLTQYPSGSR